jgi:hypothetical protein
MYGKDKQMGRNHFTYASRILVKKENTGKVLTLFDFPLSENGELEEDLINCLSDNGWKNKDSNNEVLEFEYEDESDEDFNWEIFESIAVLVEPGSYYEESIDDNEVYGGYVTKKTLKMARYRLPEKKNLKRTLIEKRIKYLSTIEKINSVNKKYEDEQNAISSGFPYEIDTCFWKNKDSDWKENRKNRWVEIEKILIGLDKSKKGISIIKQYYNKGKMPSWKKLEEWDSHERHLDLFCFLWLHPSKDFDVLRGLRDQYVNSNEILKDDILLGLYSCKSIGTSYGTGAGRGIDKAGGGYETVIMHSFGNNELLFRLCFGNLEETHIVRTLERKNYYTHMVEVKEERIEKPTMGLSSIRDFDRWLYLPELDDSTEDMLAQYKGILEWWKANFPKEKKRRFEREMPLIYVALYRIRKFDDQNFDCQRRLGFAKTLIRFLDEGGISPVITEMWDHINQGIVEIEKPWERNPPYGKVKVSVAGALLT